MPPEDFVPGINTLGTKSFHIDSQPMFSILINPKKMDNTSTGNEHKIPSGQFSEKSIKLKPANNVLLFTSLLSAILYFGKALFIPLSIALLIGFLLYPACAWMERKGFKRSMAITISHLLLFILIAAIISLLVKQFINFSQEWDELSLKIQELLRDLDNYLLKEFDISIEDQNIWFKNIIGSSGTQVIPFIKDTTYSLSIIVVFSILIPILSALILYYRKLLLEVLNTLFPGNYNAVHKTLQDSVTSYYNFVKGMLIVYLIVGSLNSIGLAIIGIPHPILFGFIASILTFIPYVGIIVASLLPMTVGWLTYSSVWYPLGVIIVFGIVQFLEANIIFPFAVGNRLKINPLVTIVTILAGGILWGAAGMILFIPYIGILKLVADRSDRLKIFSILLGTNNKGKI